MNILNLLIFCNRNVFIDFWENFCKSFRTKPLLIFWCDLNKTKLLNKISIPFHHPLQWLPFGMVYKTCYLGVEYWLKIYVQRLYLLRIFHAHFETFHLGDMSPLKLHEKFSQTFVVNVIMICFFFLECP